MRDVYITFDPALEDESPLSYTLMDHELNNVFVGGLLLRYGERNKLKIPESIEGNCFLQVTLPSGRTQTQPLSLPPASAGYEEVHVKVHVPSEAVRSPHIVCSRLAAFNHIPDSRMKLGLVHSAAQTGLETVDNAGKLWFQLWCKKRGSENWVREVDNKFWPYDDNGRILLQLPMKKTSNRLLQIGGPTLPWRLISLPIRRRATITIEHLPDSKAGKDYLTWSVTGSSTFVDVVLSYLQAGNVGGLRQIISPEIAEELVRKKRVDPWAAAVGCYFLLRTGELERLHDWTQNLANWMDWFPDGPIIRAWYLLRQRPPGLAEAREELLRVKERGLPMFTEGLVLLRDGLCLFDEEAEGRDDAISAACAWLRPYLAGADWSSPITSYLGREPEQPTALSDAAFGWQEGVTTLAVLSIERVAEVETIKAELKLDAPVVRVSSEIQREPESEEGALVVYFMKLLPQAYDLIARWLEQFNLRLLPQVLGEDVTLDIRMPGPVYISILGDDGVACWRSRLFAETYARVYPISDYPQDMESSISFEEGLIRIDLANYPADDRWRAFYLAQEEPLGCGEDERELFVLCRKRGVYPTRPKAGDAFNKLVQFVLEGRIIEAWQEAVGLEEMDDARLEILVTMMFNQMEVLLNTAKNEILGSLIEQSLEKPLAIDLDSLPRVLDAFKQVLMERLRKRMKKDGN